MIYTVGVLPIVSFASGVLSRRRDTEFCPIRCRRDTEFRSIRSPGRTKKLRCCFNSVRYSPIRSSIGQNGCLLDSTPTVRYGPIRSLYRQKRPRCCFSPIRPSISKKAAISNKGCAAASLQFNPIRSGSIRFGRLSAKQKQKSPSVAAPIRFRPLSAKKVSLLQHFNSIRSSGTNKTKPNAALLLLPDSVRFGPPFGPP